VSTISLRAASLTAPSDPARSDFDALYQRVQPSLWRYVNRLVGDADTADDVVQEAFVRLLSRPALAGDGARLWLFTVATNLVRDRGRTTARRRRLLSAFPLETHARADDERVERSERVQAVRTALGKLAERDRQLLLMREEGFRYHEIAEVVGVAPGSVGTLIARAVRKFTDVYESTDG
jgi:RNA polymerase sigma-70 factor, ECF subfamily